MMKKITNYISSKKINIKILLIILGAFVGTVTCIFLALNLIGFIKLLEIVVISLYGMLVVMFGAMIYDMLIETHNKKGK